MNIESSSTLKRWKTSDIIPKGKETKRGKVKVGFQKNKDHYIFSEGTVDNYKFETTLEYSEMYKQDGVFLVEWADINDNYRKFYSGKNVLNDACTGLNGQLVASDKLQVKSVFTFIKRGSATLLTFDKIKDKKVKEEEF